MRVTGRFGVLMEECFHTFSLRRLLAVTAIDSGHFSDICKCIFVNEKFFVLIRISLKFVPKDSINNKSALVQVMVSRRIGAKPLPKTMLTQFTDA